MSFKFTTDQLQDKLCATLLTYVAHGSYFHVYLIVELDCIYKCLCFRQAHTLTVLVIFSCILVYVAVLEDPTNDSDYNMKR